MNLEQSYSSLKKVEEAIKGNPNIQIRVLKLSSKIDSEAQIALLAQKNISHLNYLELEQPTPFVAIENLIHLLLS